MKRDVIPAGKKRIEFGCGCKLEHLDWDEIIANPNCPATWEMIGKGLTKGVFQLEGSLGRNYSKKIKPTNLEELSDVISLIRPGCLEAEYREDPVTGKMLSITDTYIKVRDGELQPEYLDQSLEPILSSTYGVPVYQEQIMTICQDFAGFDLTEADKTRKAVGKKIPELMAKVEDMFVQGALKMGHDEGMARIIFSWIDKFSGYGFNKSHGVGYAAIGYMTAFAKVHFPKEFFKSMLSFSDSKQDEFDEKKQLVYEARLFGLNVNIPSVRRMNINFEIDGDNIYYGLSHVKGVGESSVGGLNRLRHIQTPLELFRMVFIKGNAPGLKKSVVETLIKVGAFDYLGINRIVLLARYRFLSILTEREANYVLNNDEYGELEVNDWFSILVNGDLPRFGEARIDKINQEWEFVKKDLGGNRKKMALAFEKHLLGMPITGSELDLYDNPYVDTSCANFLSLKNNSKASLGVIIEEVRKIKDKNKNDMCFLKIRDASYMLDSVVVFSSVYKKLAWIIAEGKAVLIKGKKSGESLLVDFIDHL